MASYTTMLAVSATLMLTLSHPAALAGTADVKSSDGGQMQFEYRGDNLLRVNMREGNYMLIKDDHVYVVSNSNGEIMVVDLAQTMGMFGSMASAASPSAVEGKLLSFKPTGASETVAGIKGEVYQVRFIDHEGKEKTSELVLADDRRAIEFQRAMSNMTSSIGKAAGKDAQGANELWEKLSGMKKGILRFGQDMTVTALSGDPVDKSRFVLPAEPTDLSAMQGMFGGGPASGKENTGGGFMSSIFGSKGEPQKDTVDEKTDNEVDKSAEPVMGKALDKAFGKLFGK